MCGLSCLFEGVILFYLTTALFLNHLEKDIFIMSNKYVATISKDFNMRAGSFLQGLYITLYIFNLICII